jgi:hypothetical protein
VKENVSTILSRYDWANLGTPSQGHRVRENAGKSVQKSGLQVHGHHGASQRQVPLRRHDRGGRHGRRYEAVPRDRPTGRTLPRRVQVLRKRIPRVTLFTKKPIFYSKRTHEYF